MSGKRTRKTLHQNAEFRAPTMTDAVLTDAVLTTPAITGGTQSSPTITTPVLTTPALTNGTQDSPAITTPTLVGALSGGTLNTDLAGAAAAIEGALLDSPTPPTVDPTGATVAFQAPVAQRMTITLAADDLSIPHADDYGSIQLSGDMPTAYILLGSAAALTFTHVLLTGDASTVQMAVGTIAAVNTALSGDADDTVANVAATGTTTGTYAVAAAANPAAGIAAGVTGDLYLNAESPVTASDIGVLTITGTIDVWYIPLVA